MFVGSLHKRGYDEHGRAWTNMGEHGRTIAAAGRGVVHSVPDNAAVN